MFSVESKNCILIDDDSEDIEFFEHALSQLLYSVNVRFFNSFDQAISLIRSKNSKPHYVFVDSLMPGMDHDTHIQKLKHIYELTGAPIIIISSINTESIRVRFKDFLIHDFLQKQGSIEDLKNMLHDFFQRNL